MFQHPHCTNQPRGWRCRLGLLALVTLLMFAGNGCVRRRLTVRTTPPGAQVYVDDQEVGSSPASTSFVYYGTRKVTVIKDGYETQTLYERIFPPWFEFPGLDFVNEVLNPYELRDERVVDIALVPTQIVPEEQLLSRADALRSGGITGQVTGLPGTAPGFVVPAAPPPNGLPGLPGQGIGTTPPVGQAPLPPGTYPQAAPLFPQPPTGAGVIVPPR